MRLIGQPGLFQIGEQLWADPITGKIDAVLAARFGKVCQCRFASGFPSGDLCGAEHGAQNVAARGRGIAPTWQIGRGQYGCGSDGKEMGGVKVSGGDLCGVAPLRETLLIQPLHAFVATRQIGQKTVDTPKVETAHDIQRQAPQLVAFIEQGQQDQKTVRSALVEGNRQFFLSGAPGKRARPGCNHCALSALRALRIDKGEQCAIGFEQLAIDFVIVDHNVEAVFNFG